MVDKIERVVEQTDGDIGARQTTRVVSTDSPAARANYAARIVWFVVGVVVTILAVRVVLALIGANLDNPFASFVYTVSDPFVAPFRGLLQVGQFQAGVSRLELETLVAAAIYLLIGWGIASLVRLASRR